MKTVFNQLKRAMLLLAVICAALTSMAQDYEYVPLVREGVKWEYSYLFFPFSWPESSPLHIDFPTEEDEDFDWMSQFGINDPVVRYTTEFRGDTIIGGIQYSKHHLNFLGYDFVTDFMREDNGRVYAIRNADCDFIDYSCPRKPSGVPSENYESLGEMLVFDFNDMSNVIGADTVDHVEMVNIGGKLRKKTVWTIPSIIFDDDEPDGTPIVTIEGIGTDARCYGRMPFNFYANLTMSGNYTYHLLRTIGPDGKTEYSRYPDMYSAIDRVETTGGALSIAVGDGVLHVQLPDTAPGRLDVFDMMGRVACTVPTNGGQAVTLPALPAGIYVVRYSAAGHQSTQKVRI